MICIGEARSAADFEDGWLWWSAIRGAGDAGLSQGPSNPSLLGLLKCVGEKSLADARGFQEKNQAYRVEFFF
jgi:hypothetical protein